MDGKSVKEIKLNPLIKITKSISSRFGIIDISLKTARIPKIYQKNSSSRFGIWIPITKFFSKLPKFLSP